MATGFLPDMTPPGTTPTPKGKLPTSGKAVGHTGLASPKSPAPQKRGLSTSARSVKGRRR